MGMKSVNDWLEMHFNKYLHKNAKIGYVPIGQIRLKDAVAIEKFEPKIGDDLASLIFQFAFYEDQIFDVETGLRYLHLRDGFTQRELWVQLSRTVKPGNLIQLCVPPGGYERREITFKIGNSSHTFRFRHGSKKIAKT